MPAEGDEHEHLLPRVDGLRGAMQSSMRYRILFLALLATGCSPGVRFQPTQEYQRSNRAPDQIRIYMVGRRVPKRTTDVGTIETHCTYCTAQTGTSIRLLQEEASRLGLDGVRDVECAGPGTVHEGMCHGIGFVFGGAEAGDEE